MVEMRRHEEARTVARANRIEAVIRLCSGRVDDWESFLRNTDAEGLSRQDRRSLRLQSASAKSRTKRLVGGFNQFLFNGATETVFEALFQAIKAGIPLGLRMPILEFEKNFVPLRREVDKGRDQCRPFHATISITLLGLSYEYPEWHFANVVREALTEARELARQLAPFSGQLDQSLKRKWDRGKATGIAPDQCAHSADWARKLAAWLFPEHDENRQQWRKIFEERFAVVDDDVFNFLTETGTEVSARVRIDDDTKTVMRGALWYEESLPAETILSGMVWCDRLFNGSGITREVLLQDFCPIEKTTSLQIGGKGTVGRGQVRCMFSEGGERSA